MKKTIIVYGQTESALMQRALAELSKTRFASTGAYPACFPYERSADHACYRCIYMGTKANNPYISENSTAVLTQAENGDQLTIYGENNNWYSVKFGTVTGFANAAYVVVNER